ncbi:negative transcriptional regulator, PaiB family [Burkholderia sp. D7]|nr:negative transcriptional regulator, PaiB family [Burkholderia sp. D7]
MYSKPAFAPTGDAEVHDFIDGAVFGTLISRSPDALVISHLIFMLDRDRGTHGTLVSHLSRANEHCALVEQGAESAVVFVGEHGYISSSWYPGFPSRDSAPTWNFSVVHCHGRPRALDSGGSLAHLQRAVEHLERGRDAPWELKELGEAGIARRLAHIVAFELPVERLEAKFKMGQDERLPDTCAAIDHLEAAGACPLATEMAQRNRTRT